MTEGLEERGEFGHCCGFGIFMLLLIEACNNTFNLFREFFPTTRKRAESNTTTNAVRRRGIGREIHSGNKVGVRAEMEVEISTATVVHNGVMGSCGMMRSNP